MRDRLPISAMLAALLAGRFIVNEGKLMRLAAQMEAQAALGRLERELQSPVDLPGWKQAIGNNEDSHEEK